MQRHSRLGVCRWLVGFGVPCLLAAGVLSTNEAGAQQPDPKESRILVDGKKQLFRKVIVTGDDVQLFTQLPNDAAAVGAKVEPYAIYTKLKLDTPPAAGGRDGEVVQNGSLFVRVGDFSTPPVPFGYLKVQPRKPLGKILTDSLKLSDDQLALVAKEKSFQEEVSVDFLDWDTRFTLYPKPGAAHPFVTHLLPNFEILAAEYAGQAGGVRNKVMAPILDKPRDEKTQIFPVVCYTGTTAGTAATVSDLNLEIVFVIDTTASMTPLLDGTKKAVQDCINLLAADPKLKSAVRFGVIEYQDNTPGLIPEGARVVSKLTNQFDVLQKTFGALTVAKQGSQETQEDVLAGLNLAISKDAVGWSDNSTKIVVLVGDASAHLTDPKDPTKPHPKNTTKMSYADILKVAASDVGSEYDNRVATKYFFAVHVQNAGDEPDSKLAQKQFSELAKNNNRMQGYYKSVDPNDEGDRGRLVTDLVGKVKTGFEGLQSVRKGDVKGAEAAAKQSPFAEASYRALLATTGKRIPVTYGFSGERNKDGREVAEIRVMIRERELKDLRNTMDFIHKQFIDTTPEDRQDVGRILNKIRQALSESVAGQLAKANEPAEIAKLKLQELLGDLPLTPGVLNLTLAELAAKKDDQFKAWLTELRQTVDVATKLLEKARESGNIYALEVKYGVKGSDGEERKEWFLFPHPNELP